MTAKKTVIKMAKKNDVVLSEAQQQQLDMLLAAAPAAFGLKEGDSGLKQIQKKIVKAFLAKVKADLACGEHGEGSEKDFNWASSVKSIPRRIAA